MDINELINLSDYELAVELAKGNIDLRTLAKVRPDPVARKKVREMSRNVDLDREKREEERRWAIVKKNCELDELEAFIDDYPNSIHAAEARGMIARHEELQHWKQAKDSDDVGKLQIFINDYPRSEYVKEARSLINEIKNRARNRQFRLRELAMDIDGFQRNKLLTDEQVETGIKNAIMRRLNTNQISKDDFLSLLKEDNNLLNAHMINVLINVNVITPGDLSDIGIDDRFIYKLTRNAAPQNYDGEYRPLEKIDWSSTEVYFWGVPSSGKSCAIGAILSAAHSGNVAKSIISNNASQGYGYMNHLKDVFRPDMVISLVAGTAKTCFYEMGFTLVDNDNKKHRITLIDMAGELMQCLYKKDADEGQLTDADKTMLGTLNKVLVSNRTRSRKMHFFVIEYGVEDREGQTTQDTYLRGAMNYLRSLNIFKDDTDAIFIMITKADKAKAESAAEFRNYIQSHFKGFYKDLCQICEENEINGGRVESLAFSLGNVCFQNYCLFDPRSAEFVVKTLIDRTPAERSGFGKWFSK